MLLFCWQLYLCLSILFSFHQILKETVSSPTKMAASGILMTMGGGTTIQIDKIKDSIIRNANGTTIHIKNGQIAYDDQIETAAFTVNTISTRAGQQYKVNLPDGTKVWLNALSSISFPSRFEDKIRRVGMEGEVYFEVAKDKAKPFHC